MQALQKRLEETEAQMTRILQAMQLMQSRMNSAVLNEEDSNIINDNGTVRESSDGSSAVETLGSLVDEQENDLKNEQSLVRKGFAYVCIHLDVYLLSVCMEVCECMFLSHLFFII